MKHSIEYAFVLLRSKSFEINTIMDDLHFEIKNSSNEDKEYFVDMLKWTSMIMYHNFQEALAIKKELGFYQ